MTLEAQLGAFTLHYQRERILASVDSSFLGENSIHGHLLLYNTHMKHFWLISGGAAHRHIVSPVTDATYCRQNILTTTTTDDIGISTDAEIKSFRPQQSGTKIDSVERVGTDEQIVKKDTRVNCSSCLRKVFLRKEPFLVVMGQFGAIRCQN